jgi:hypothetical protein
LGVSRLVDLLQNKQKNGQSSWLVYFLKFLSILTIHKLGRWAKLHLGALDYGKVNLKCFR